jgi:DNA-binding response OmpR family regulator
MRAVLVVDDEPLLVMTLGMALDEAGFRVVEAHDGLHALEVLRTTKVDLVVTDYMMPRLSGLDLALAIKSDPATENLPVLLMSAVPGDVLERHPGVFAGFFQKPYDIDRLLAVVAGLLGLGS